MKINLYFTLAFGLITSLYSFGQIGSNCLEANYLFNGNPADSSAYARHSTEVGNINYVADRFGNPGEALALSGSSYLETNHSFDYASRTVSVWFSFDQIGIGTQNVLAQDANTLNHGPFHISLQNGNLEARAGGIGSQTIGTNINANQWYHVVLVRNQNNLEYYLNGQLVNSATANSGGSGSSISNQLAIGTNRNRSGNYLNGKIDDLVIYSCAATAAQVDSIFKAGGAALAAISPACLEANYLFAGNNLDSSSNARHATVFGNTNFGTDRYGNPSQSVVFDGSSYLETNHSFDYASRTVSIWFSFDQIGIGTQNVLAQDANTLNHGAFHISLQNGNLEARAGGIGPQTIGTNINANQWYHVVLVRNQNNLEYYLDGQLVATGAANNGGSGVLGNAQLAIGTNRSRTSNFLNGKVDDLMIFSCAASAAQVDSIFQAGSFSVASISTGCLEADYYLNGNTADSSANSRHAMVVGNTGFTTDRFGNPGKAIYLDGASYLETSHSFDYASRTLSVWFSFDQVGTATQNVLAQDANTLNHGAIHISLKNGNLEARAGGIGPQTIGTNINANQWYHVVLVRNQNNLEYYLDGQLVATGAANNGGSGALGNAQLAVGTDRSRARNFFNGKIDDLKIYSCAASPAQVDSIFKAPDQGLSRTEQRSEALVESYPNPVNKYLRVRTPYNTDYRIMLVNITGKRMLYRRVEQQQVNLNLEHLPQGIYFLVLERSGQTTYVEKIIKE